METGKRAAKLNALFIKWMNKVIKSIDLNHVAHYLGDIYNEHPVDLANIHTSMCQYMQAEFMKIYEGASGQRNVLGKLNSLDQLIQESRTQPSTPRTTPDPKQVMQAHRVKLKMQELERLHNLEAQLRQQNELYMNEIATKKEQLINSVNAAADITQFQKSFETISSIPVQELESLMERLSETRLSMPT